MSSCQVGRTSWGWGGKRVRRTEFGAPLVSRWQITLWRRPTATDSLCSQSQVADCSLQPVSPLALIGICSFLEAPTYLHQGSRAVWHLNLFVSCGDQILGINTELLTGMPFLYSSLQLHILEAPHKNILFKENNACNVSESQFMQEWQIYLYQKNES